MTTTLTPISQELAQRLAKLIDDYSLVELEEWQKDRDAILRELQPPDPMTVAIEKVQLLIDKCAHPDGTEPYWETIKTALARLAGDRAAGIAEGRKAMHAEMVAWMVRAGYIDGAKYMTAEGPKP